MNLIMILSIFTLSNVYAQTGRTIQGPETYGHPSYPNSGPLRNRSNDMTGEDMSNATKMGSDISPIVPERRPLVKSKKDRPAQTGPYRDDQYDFAEEGKDGLEAQEAAEEKSFDLSREEIKDRQDPLWNEKED